MRRTYELTGWKQFAGVDWRSSIMSVTTTDRFHAKQGRSIGRWRLRAGNRTLTVYLKRHYRLEWWRSWLALIWPQRDWSPGLQEWKHLHWAQELGLPVPRVWAAGEFIGPGPRLQSFLAVEELADMLPLHEAIPAASEKQQPLDFIRWKRGLIAELVRLTRCLHDRDWFHKDLYLCHFYIPRQVIETIPDSWRGLVHIIDFHRLSRHRWTSAWWRVKDLAQLLYSSEIRGVNVRDRLLFWRLYGKGRSWRRLILWKWQAYRRHNLKRKRKP
ncbi:MAG: lipopolysaccharide core heptose(I) kinase [Gemmatales bacterium]|nr:MAG: lipopolysaccharide core heptose(I) kinase [Gemmatales bacterium]